MVVHVDGIVHGCAEEVGAVDNALQAGGGDVQLIMQPANYEAWQDLIDDGTTHGTWHPYDTHIPFLITGWHVPHGSTGAQVYITDIAATVCALIHVQMPNGCIGTPVTRIIDR